MAEIPGEVLAAAGALINDLYWGTREERAARYAEDALLLANFVAQLDADNHKESA